MDARKNKIPRWQNDPFCPIDWRAQDASNLVAGKKTKWADGDPIVTEYADFVRMVRDSESDQRRVRQLWPTISMAHEIAHQNNPRRWELEARILAQQSDEEIATRLGLPPEAIGMYEQLFFSVRHCLGSYMYIAEQTIGSGRWNGFGDHELGRLWMACGYYGNAVVLEALIDAFYAVWEPDQPATLSVYLRPDAGVDRGIQVFVASSVLPSLEPTTLFFDFHVRLMEADATEDQGRAALIREQVKNNVIRCARAWLAEKLLPKLERQRATKRNPMDRGTKGSVDTQAARRRPGADAGKSRS